MNKGKLCTKQTLDKVPSYLTEVNFEEKQLENFFMKSINN